MYASRPHSSDAQIINVLFCILKYDSTQNLHSTTMSLPVRSLEMSVSGIIRQFTPRRPTSLPSSLPLRASRSIVTQTKPRFAQAATSTPAKPSTAAKPSTSSQPPQANTSSSQILPELQEDDPSNVDWSKSFYGLSTEPFAKEAADILLAPIDPEDIEVKPDGIIYLPEIKYRRILNRAFGPGGWGLAPRGEAMVTERAVTREYALLAHGRFA